MKPSQLLRLPWFVLFCAFQMQNHPLLVAQTVAPKAPPSVLDTPVAFSGWQGATLKPEQLDQIRLGLFAPSDRDDPVGGPMLNAAMLAIEEANRAGGLQGVPFELVTRWASDPWSAGSKAVIKLVYRDSVWAVIGSSNGAATHIAEQIATKAWVPLLSPVSADPTLTYIRIPWMFRLPPDDEKQAEVILDDGIRALSLTRIGLITATDHDGRTFAAVMLRQLQAGPLPPAFHFQISLANVDFGEIAQRAMALHPDGIILRLPPAETLTMLDHFRSHEFRVPVFLPWIPGLREQDLTRRYDGGILWVQPFSVATNPRYVTFVHAYQRKYGSRPCASAAYTYDAVRLLVQSLRKSGLNRARLREAIASLGDYQGVTGGVSWDHAGGNQAQPVLRTLSKESSVAGK